MTGLPVPVPDVAATEASTLRRALNGFLWLDNNRHNYGSDAWLDLFDAAVIDGREAAKSCDCGVGEGCALPGCKGTPATEPVVECLISALEEIAELTEWSSSKQGHEIHGIARGALDGK